MHYEIQPCTDDDADFIDEQSDRIVNGFSSPEGGDEEEAFIYQVTDQEEHLLGGCILVTDELKTASIYDLWVEEA